MTLKGGLFVIQIPAAMTHLLLVTVGLIVLDTLLGWTLALQGGTWDWRKVGRFVETSILPYVGGLLGLAAVAVLAPQSAAVFYASAAAADVKLLADVFAKVGQLGMPVVQDATGAGQASISVSAPVADVAPASVPTQAAAPSTPPQA